MRKRALDILVAEREVEGKESEFLNLREQILIIFFPIIQEF